MTPDALPLQLRSKIEVDESGCWLWTAAATPGGYARINYQKRQKYAHRLAYELLVGPIPDGLTIDHLCRVRNCINPAHLEAVTLRENLLRGNTVAAMHARKTHCPRGHPYAGPDAEVYRYRGQRVCRRCSREKAEEQRIARLGSDVPHSQMRPANAGPDRGARGVQLHAPSAPSLGADSESAHFADKYARSSCRGRGS
jgi:hypothetical protein